MCRCVFQNKNRASEACSHRSSIQKKEESCSSGTCIWENIAFYMFRFEERASSFISRDVQNWRNIFPTIRKQLDRLKINAISLIKTIRELKAQFHMWGETNVCRYHQVPEDLNKKINELINITSELAWEKWNPWGVGSEWRYRGIDNLLKAFPTWTPPGTGKIRGILI